MKGNNFHHWSQFTPQTVIATNENFAFEMKIKKFILNYKVKITIQSEKNK